MPTTITPTETDVFTALRAVALLILPDGVEVIRGQANKVSSPAADDYVVTTSSLRGRLATTVETWDHDDPAPTELTFETSTRATIQCDVHGPNAADNATRLASLLRTGWACEQFAAQNLGVTPLGTSDPKQAPYINGEQQYEDRWAVDVELQINPVVTVPEQFADALTIGLINVDAAYPPGG